MSGAPQDNEDSQALGEQAWNAFIKQNVTAKLDPHLKGDTIVASELMGRILNRSLANSDVNVTASARLRNNVVYLSPSLFKLFERFHHTHLLNLNRLRKTD